MTNSELVFISPAAAGHVISIVELAKLLVDRDERLSITVLTMKLLGGHFSPDSDLPGRIKIIDLPNHDFDSSLDVSKFVGSITEKAKPHVKDVVSKMISRSQSTQDSPRLAGFVLDMTFSTMVDVANGFGVPSYIFFPSGAAFLGLLLYMQDTHDEQGMDLTEFTRSDDELAVPSFAHPVPFKVLPTPVLHKDWLLATLDMTRKFRETNGIIVNTFSELEPHALNALADGKIPPVYAVGPILNLKRNGHGPGNNDFKEIMQWLDVQPPSSVVFLCFGSMGSLRADQLKEIARALENTGCRFLWSLHKHPAEDKMEQSTESSRPHNVLPDGFLDRTSYFGRVIGWAPQVDVLAHPSIGGFVSHCGWNSTLEGIRFGVPIAAWPLYAEQQLNAFELVVELGLAVEVKMDYVSDQFNPIFEVITLPAEEIERGIRHLMKHDGKRIKLVKEMSENSKKALTEGGSSYMTIGRLIKDIFNSIC